MTDQASIGLLGTWNSLTGTTRSYILYTIYYILYTIHTTQTLILMESLVWLVSFHRRDETSRSAALGPCKRAE